MPALYAHKRFGDEVTATLEGELKEVIQKFPLQFRIGLQGPDPFFFYRPILHTHVSKCAGDMHNEKADIFFQKAIRVIREKGRKSREYAYILGFICHFALDSECHPYVNQTEKRIQVGHMEIEGEFEKYLLRKDKKNALSYPVYKLIPTDVATVEAISSLFPNLTKAEIKESLVSYYVIKKVFTAPSQFKQAVINLLLKAAGVYKKYYGLMHTYHDNPACEETNKELEMLLQNAISVARDLILSYDESVREGEMLSARFGRTYD